MERPKSVDEIMGLTDIPAVGADDRGTFVFVNDAFTKTFGWTQEDLIGHPLTTIIPDHMRDTHRVGFSRFLATEKATLAGKPLPLAIKYKDGTVADAEHFILADKKDGHWRFAATITRRNPA